jgi:hypothetical protein
MKLSILNMREKIETVLTFNSISNVLHYLYLRGARDVK